MATTKELLVELDGIWLATRRSERRDRIQATILGLGGVISGVCLAIGLAHIYSSLAGLQ
jgi:allophanate hydrolase subunit 1